MGLETKTDGALKTPLLDKYLSLRDQLTNMMNQYLDTKDQYRDAILFYRMGDFYEMFLDDAVLASSVLDIVLTGRSCGLETQDENGEPVEERAPMCGVPFHSMEPYVAKLVGAGYKVAICEQMEDLLIDDGRPKGPVRREVVRVITPGTVIDPVVLDESKNNYLCAVCQVDGGVGVSFADVSTGEVACAEFVGKSCLFEMQDELAKYAPAEMILNPTAFDNRRLAVDLANRFSLYPQGYPDWVFGYEEAIDRLKKQYDGKGLGELGLENYPRATRAVGALLFYLYDTQKTQLSHLGEPVIAHRGEYMELDVNTRRHLELSTTMRTGMKKGSLVWVLDRTKTAMGARLLRRWIEQPLMDCLRIRRRQDAVEAFYRNSPVRGEMFASLAAVHDIERILTRIVYDNANCRDLTALKESIRCFPQIYELLGCFSSGILAEYRENFDMLSDIETLIQRAIVDNPPFSLREGGFIRGGYDEQLDEYREAMQGGRDWITDLEAKERQSTGIKNLRIGYNKVFGYYIEVTRSQLDQVPDRYIRKQTLTGTERFITQELKELETTVLEAEEKSIQLEYKLFSELRFHIADEVQRIQKMARLLAEIDVFCALAETAVQNGYCRPEVTPSDRIVIRDGRHPVVEEMQRDRFFVPNDTDLDTQDKKIAVITGPNMAGKSTYMRQVALIVLLAQVGSFVPALSAEIGICDRIFTRVGASDDLSSGQSTFMVEMNEVANILKNATNKSLLVLDEIGRGTSTYDGLSIAWAVIEYIEKTKRLRCRTLFATHYHELTELENHLTGVKNYCIAVKKRGDDITFLRKIVSGGADSSYGIEVALLAGVPRDVINRAREIQQSLQKNDIAARSEAAVQEEAPVEENNQIGFLSTLQDGIAEELLSLDLSTLTPIEALNKLYEMQGKIRQRLD